MVKKILVPRSVVATSMGFVVKNAIDKFGPNVEINILSRPENAHAMKQISRVKNVLPYAPSSFHIKKTTPQQINEMQKLSFDMIIIPINGYPDSYDNVKYFCVKFFGKIPLYYYNTYTQKFFINHNNAAREIEKILIKLFSVVGTFALTVSYTLGIGFLLIRDFIFKKSK